VAASSKNVRKRTGLENAGRSWKRDLKYPRQYPAGPAGQGDVSSIPVGNFKFAIGIGEGSYGSGSDGLTAAVKLHRAVRATFAGGPGGRSCGLQLGGQAPDSAAIMNPRGAKGPSEQSKVKTRRGNGRRSSRTKRAGTGRLQPKPCHMRAEIMSYSSLRGNVRRHLARMIHAAAG